MNVNMSNYMSYILMKFYEIIIIISEEKLIYVDMETRTDDSGCYTTFCYKNISVIVVATISNISFLSLSTWSYLGKLHNLFCEQIKFNQYLNTFNCKE